MKDDTKREKADAAKAKAKAEQAAKKEEAEEPKKTKLFTKPIRPGGGGFRAIVRK